MMNKLTLTELSRLSTQELQGLRTQVQQALLGSDKHSTERREALAQLELIDQALCYAYTRSNKPGF